MVPFQRSLLIGSICAIVGFIAGREQMKYQIASNFVQAFSGFANGLPSSKPDVPLHPVDTVKKPSDILSKILVSNVSLKRESFVTEMYAHIKNDTPKTIASLTLQYSLLSPGREVPWVKGDNVRFSIDGGLAPGEERNLSGIGMNPDLILLKSGMDEHPDAVLSVGVAEARLPNGGLLE